MLPISAVAEVLYCPRNFYFRVVEGAEESNHHLLEGRLQEEARGERLSQTRGGVRQERKIPVRSEFFGIAGEIDVVEEKDGQRYPVEYKKGAMHPSTRDDVQLCCQALLLEEALGGEIAAGYIYYAGSSSRRLVRFTEELRELTVQTIERARSIVEEMVVPEPVNDQRCNGCSLAARCLPGESAYFRGRLKGKPGKVVPSANLGRVLYVNTPGASLKKRAGWINVVKDESKITEVPLTSIDQVVLVGRVNASVPLLNELIQHGIPTYLCSPNGRVAGWLQPAWGKNSLLRLAQVTLWRSFDR